MPKKNTVPTIEQVRRREKINGFVLKSAAVVATAIITFFVLSVVG
jgi:hypothetical protein